MKERQSRQGEQCGRKVEPGLGRHSNCSKEKTGEVKERTGIKKCMMAQQRKFLKESLEGKRLRGRLRRRWIDNFKLLSNYSHTILLFVLYCTEGGVIINNNHASLDGVTEVLEMC